MNSLNQSGAHGCGRVKLVSEKPGRGLITHTRPSEAAPHSMATKVGAPRDWTGQHPDPVTWSLIVSFAQETCHSHGPGNLGLTFSRARSLPPVPTTQGPLQADTATLPSGRAWPWAAPRPAPFLGWFLILPAHPRGLRSHLPLLLLSARARSPRSPRSPRWTYPFLGLSVTYARDCVKC